MLTILNGVNQYFVDEGSFPEGPYSDCASDDDTIGATATRDLANTLVPVYIADIPMDPTGGTANDTGYTICQSTGDRITIKAPSAEGDDGTISATR